VPVQGTVLQGSLCNPLARRPNLKLGFRVSDLSVDIAHDVLDTGVILETIA